MSSMFHVGQVIRVRISAALLYVADFDGVVVKTARDHIKVMKPLGKIEDHYHHGFFLLAPTKKKDARVLCAQRSDGYWFYGVKQGKRVRITAGCRQFLTAGEARKHWKKRQREDVRYYDKAYKLAYRSVKGVNTRRRNRKLNAWSLAFVKKVERL